MSEVSITGDIVRPTRNDVGDNGQGRFWTEQTMTKTLRAAITDRVVSGGDVPTSVNLTTTISAMVALINGYQVETPATNITAPSGSTVFVFCALKKDGDDNVTEAIFEVSTSSTPTYDDSILLARLTTSGSAITASRDFAPRGIAGALTPLVFMGLFGG